MIYNNGSPSRNRYFEKNTHNAEQATKIKKGDATSRNLFKLFKPIINMITRPMTKKPMIPIANKKLLMNVYFSY